MQDRVYQTAIQCRRTEATASDRRLGLHEQSVINKAIDEWLAACVRAKGRHFEHLLC